MKHICLLILAFGLLTACDDVQTHLDEIKESGELRVLTRYSPTTYYVKGEGWAGFEYELAQKFAKHLDVHLTIIVPENLGIMLNLIANGKADIAAAGLTVTPARQDIIRFGPVYQEVTQQLVYRRGNKRPKNITELNNGQLEVVANSSHVEQLQILQQDVPELSWTENSELDSSSILELVQKELIDFTIADSNELAANQAIFPELKVAFDLTEPQPLAWAMPRDEDDSLYEEIGHFFNHLEETGELDELIEKYFGHIRRFDYVDTRALHRRIQTELPKYQSLFEQAAIDNGFDWQFLAAISYQESHWDPKAVSSTGVRGLMMLTLDTAKRMKIKDREDPAQSIHGGAAYLALLKKSIPERISEPDKTWLALAAYNVGLGHLEDARVLADRTDKNPDLWSEVKTTLPLLSKKQWYSQVKYGYARGGEPVRYVENIRRYYDILLLQAASGYIEPELESDTQPKSELPAL